MHQKSMKRIIIYLLGLISLSLGVVLNSKSNLGVSPVTLLPYFMTYVSSLSIGTAIFIFNIVYFLFELAIMNKDRIKPVILLQLVFSLIFGLLSNLFSHFITPASHFIGEQLLTLAAAIFFTCLGVICMVSMDIVTTPPDALVNEMTFTLHKDYGFCKNVLDLCCVALTLLLCLLITHKIVSIGIGTVICALFNGRVMYLLNKILHPFFISNPKC